MADTSSSYALLTSCSSFFISKSSLISVVSRSFISLTSCLSFIISCISACACRRAFIVSPVHNSTDLPSSTFLSSISWTCR